MIVFVVGTLVILVFLAWGTYRTAQVLPTVPESINLLLLPAENLARLVLIAVCFALGQVSGLPYSTLGWLSIEPGRDLAIGLVTGVIVAVTIPPITQWAVGRFGRQVYSPEVVLRILPRSRREWVLVPLALVWSVFLEELIFRSLLLGGFGSFIAPALLAVVWSVVFGAMHLPQGALGLVVATVLGLLLSALFLATAGLLAPFVAHYVINLLQLLWASFDKSFLETYRGSPSNNAEASSHT